MNVNKLRSFIRWFTLGGFGRGDNWKWGSGVGGTRLPEIIEIARN